MRKLALIPALLNSVALIVPFADKPGWKLTEDGSAIQLKDGNPIWVDSNGNESTMGGDTIARLNGEAKDNRERAERAEGRLKQFDGITDPAAAKKALDTVAKLDAKSLIDAGEVDKVKDQITSQFTEQLETLKTENGTLRSGLNQKTLDAAFATSGFMKDKMALPPDVARAYFAKHFEFDDKGDLVIKDAAGNQVRSKAKIGEVASFDEALEIIVNDNPNRDSLLKGANHQGSGNQGGGGGNRPGVKTYRRSEFDQLAVNNPAGASAAAAEIAAGTAQVVD